MQNQGAFGCGASIIRLGRFWSEVWFTFLTIKSTGLVGIVCRLGMIILNTQEQRILSRLVVLAVKWERKEQVAIMSNRPLGWFCHLAMSRATIWETGVSLRYFLSKIYFFLCPLLNYYCPSRRTSLVFSECGSRRLISASRKNERKSCRPLSLVNKWPSARSGWKRNKRTRLSKGSFHTSLIQAVFPSHYWFPCIESTYSCSPAFHHFYTQSW